MGEPRVGTMRIAVGRVSRHVARTVGIPELAGMTAPRLPT